MASNPNAEAVFTHEFSLSSTLWSKVLGKVLITQLQAY